MTVKIGKEIEVSDYIPRKDDKFHDWYSFFFEYVDQRTGGNVPEWTFIPSDDLMLFRSAWNKWEMAWREVLGPHTSLQTAAKNAARKNAEAVIRPFVKRFLRFPPVTDEDRLAMNIPNPSGDSHPIPVPTVAPEMIVNTGTRRRLIVHYHTEGSEKRGKPDNVHGIEILWAILEHPPVDLDELVHSAFSTRSPLTLEYKEHERGKHVYMVGRWEINRNGEKGPFGAIIEVIIP